MTLIDRLSVTSIEKSDLLQPIAKKNKRKKHHYYLYLQENECQKHCLVTFNIMRSQFPNFFTQQIFVNYQIQI
jgi:hypothetical protein